MTKIDLDTTASQLMTINAEVHGTLPTDGRYAAGKIAFAIDQNPDSESHGMVIVWNTFADMPVFSSDIDPDATDDILTLRVDEATPAKLRELQAAYEA